MTTTAKIHNGRSVWVQQIFDLAIQVYAAIYDALYDFAVTMITLVILAGIYMTFWPQLLGWAMFVTVSIYLILMLMRILQRARQREDPTLKEIEDRIVMMDYEWNEKWDEVRRNV